MTTATRRSLTTFSAVFHWRSLKTRVTILTLAIFLIGIWSLTFYVSRMLHEDMRNQLGEQQFTTVSLAAADINSELDGRLQALEKAAIRITPSMLGNASSVQTFLEDRPVLGSMFNLGIYVTPLDGTVIADVPVSAGRIGVNYMDRDYIVDALKGKPTISKPVMGRKTLAPAVVLSAPIRDINGKVIGVLAGGTNLGAPNFLDMITESRYGKTGGYLLIAPQHKLIVTGTDKSRIMQPIPAPGINPMHDRYMQGFEGFGIAVNSRGIEELSAAKHIPVAGWFVAVVLPTEEAFAPVRGMQKRMLLAAIFLTLLAGSLIWWILKWQLEPAFTTINSLAALANTDQPLQPLPVARQDEIGSLIGGFNHLLSTLGQREEALKKAEAVETLLAEIGRLIGSTLNIDEVYERFAAEARKLIPFDSLTINLYSFQEKTLWVGYVCGSDINGRKQGDPLVLEGSLSGAVISARTGIRIQPANIDEIVGRFPRLTLIFQAGLRSIMCVPLVSQDKVIGVLHFRSKKPNAYTEQDLRLAERIGMQIAGAIANAQMFKDLSKAKMSLQASEERLGTLYKESPIPTFTWQKKGGNDFILVDFNRAAIEITNGKVGDHLGDSAVELYKDRPKILEDMNICFQERSYVRQEVTSRHFVPGRFLFVHYGFIPPDLIIVHLDDQTDRKRAEEEKAKLQSQLLQSQKMESVGSLAGGVAHDFNNMLGVIIGHTEIALDQVDPSNPLHADLQEIMNAANRSADLTRQLLAFARKQVTAPKVLDLNETVERICKMLQRLIGENIHLVWMPDANLWPVKIDPSQIDQILANLCVNARDAISGVGKMTIETGNIIFDEDYCANHAGFVPGEYVLLAVSDDGCGIDKEIIGNIFEPFFTTKVLGKGTGLGLATVYGIVKQNNGFINVYSEPDQGTTFKIYLPRQVGKPERLRVEGSSEPAPRGQETILVVEDEPSLLDLTTMLLERQGYTVLAAGTPGEAIRMAKEHAGEIHLLMTDVVMPEMNGPDLAEKMSRLYPNLKRMFTSGYTANVIAHHNVLDAGVCFIQKPFSKKDLAAKVREALDQT